MGFDEEVVVFGSKGKCKERLSLGKEVGVRVVHWFRLKKSDLNE